MILAISQAFIYTVGIALLIIQICIDLLKEAKEVKVKSDINLAKVDRYEVEGTIAIGGVTSDDLQGELKGKSLEDLRKLMIDGRVYVSVQTNDFPLGEIRGEEFIAIDRIFPDISDFQWN
jgi:hypothetical protein